VASAVECTRPPPSVLSLSCPSSPSPLAVLLLLAGHRGVFFRGQHGRRPRGRRVRGRVEHDLCGVHLRQQQRGLQGARSQVRPQPPPQPALGIPACPWHTCRPLISSASFPALLPSFSAPFFLPCPALPPRPCSASGQDFYNATSVPRGPPPGAPRCAAAPSRATAPAWGGAPCTRRGRASWTPTTPPGPTTAPCWGAPCWRRTSLCSTSGGTCTHNQ